MPVSSASRLWLRSWSSRRIRSDSPTETSTRCFAGRNSFISLPPVVVRGHLNDLDQQYVGDYSVHHPPLESEPGRTMALPLTGESFIAESDDGSQSGRPRESGDVLPLLITLQNLNGDGAGELLVDATVFFDL